MKTSINKSDEQLERLIADIEASGDSMKIVCNDLRENVEHALFSGDPLPKPFNSRSSAAYAGMRNVHKYIDEIQSLARELENHLAVNYSDKN